MFEDKQEGGKSAVVMWKTQSPWPSLRGFLYDWWLGTTGSLEGVRIGTGGYRRMDNSGIGSNLKIQLNLATMRVELVNRGRESHPYHSFASVNWYKFDGEQVLSQNGFKFGPVKPMSVARSEVIKIPTTESYQVLFAQVSLSSPKDNDMGETKNNIFRSWYWMSFNDTGDFNYDYKELGEWRDNGPYPHVSGHILSFTMDNKTEKLWWTAEVLIQVDPSSKAIAFAPQFSAFDTSGNILNPLLFEVPAVLLNEEDTTVVLHGKLNSYDSCLAKIMVDFWAGDQLEISVLDPESLCKTAGIIPNFA